MSKATKTIQASEIPEGQGRCFEIAGKKIALFNIGGKYYALDDACTHAGGPLSEGEIDGNKVVCPWHGAAFDCATGKALEPPAEADSKSYPVTVQGGELTIEVS